MKPLKFSFICLMSVLALAGCDGKATTTAESSKDDGASSTGTVSNTDTGGDVASSTTPAVDVEEDIELFMMGGLYLNNMRSIYAKLPEGVRGEVEWTSSNPASVTATTVTSTALPECLLYAKGVGEATIKAEIKDEDGNVLHSGSYDIAVQEGEQMPKELFSKLTGSMRITSTQRLLNYDADYEPSVEEEYELVTTYQETVESPDFWNGEEITDRYSLKETVKSTGEVNEYTYVRSPGDSVAKEKIGKDNTVTYSVVEDDEGYALDWDNSLYINMWGDSDTIDETYFRTFDGGKTYHCLSASLQQSYLCASMFLTDLTPDDLYLEVADDGALTLHIDVDPYNRDAEATEKYGQTIVGVIDEIGTAVVPAPEPYAHEAYHDGIKAAIDNMAGLKNYRVDYTVHYQDSGDYEYTYIFTDDTIDRTTTKPDGTIVRDGAHKEDDTHYYEYTVSNGEVLIGDEHTSYWDSPENNVNRYPTFDFAAEIFAPEGEDGYYASRGGTGEFFRYLTYLPDATSYFSLGDGSIKLDGANHIVAAKIEGTYFDEDVSIEMAFSEFGTADPELDFAAVDRSEPTSWEEDPSGIIDDMHRFFIDGETIDNFVPYTYCSVGYDGYVYHRNSDPTIAYFDTDEFETVDGDSDDAALQAFMADFQANLLAAGYALTSRVEEENDGGLVYEKDGVSISIGRPENYAGTGYLDYCRIVIRVDDAARLDWTSNW